MMCVRERIGEDGGIALPSGFRRALGLRAGDVVILRLEDGEIRVMTPRHAIERARDMVRTTIPEGRSLADELIAERRATAAEE